MRVFYHLTTGRILVMDLDPSDSINDALEELHRETQLPLMHLTLEDEQGVAYRFHRCQSHYSLLSIAGGVMQKVDFRVFVGAKNS